MEQLRITDTPAGPISYLLTRKRVKNLNLRVRNGQVSLSIPLGCPAEEADAMVRAKCRWIIQALERQWAPGPELPVDAWSTKEIFSGYAVQIPARAVVYL